MGVTFLSEPTVPVEEMRRNAERTRTLGLPKVEFAGHVAVVGGGPSLTGHLDELKAWQGPIWAINGTWRWLKQRGIEATFFTVDPKPQPWLSDDPPKTAIVAMVGCPELFGSLRRTYVRTFELGEGNVCGSVTTATAAPHLAILMGHRSVTFFGCDSSFENGASHVYCDDLPDDTVMVRVGEQLFASKPEFIMQAADLAGLCNELPKQCRNRSEGLMAALIENPEWDLAEEVA